MAEPCTVLVVEDEPLIRLDLVSILEEYGCKTYEASNAADAIMMLEANAEITIVFTDIQMPGTMDGVALAQYVRKRWPPAVIVVSSGKVRPAAGVLAEDIAFLTKPYNDIQLAEVIGEARDRLARNLVK